MASRCLCMVWLVVAGACTVFGGGSACASSWGRTPSRLGQFFGYGYGAGHHAPIVHASYKPLHVPRTTQIPEGYGPLGPAPYEVLGCYGQSCNGVPAQPVAFPPVGERSGASLLQPAAGP